MTGKNFSANNVGGKRKASDMYETPYSLTRLLLDCVELKGDILEPACGKGAILDVLKEYGYAFNLWASDISDDYIGGATCRKEGNFLDKELWRSYKFNTIITNPPFSLAYEFISRAKEMSVQGVRDIYMLLPLSYLHGKQRFDHIWSDRSFPLKEVFVFTRYPLLGEALREDGKHHTGMVVYAWYHWQLVNGATGHPVIKWLDNNPYILKKGE